MRINNVYLDCLNLPYSKNDDLSDEVFDDTFLLLNKLYEKYNYGNVLGELSKIWTLEKAVNFFSKVNIKTSKKECKTIATFYRRCYNGGVERVQSQLINLWTKMGYKVVLLTEEPSNAYDFPYSNKTKRIIIPECSKTKKRLMEIERICREEKVDIYINHGWLNNTVLWECMLMKLNNIPFVQYVHGCFAWDICKNKNNMLQPKIFKLCNLVLSLSSLNARFYQLCGCETYLIQNPIPEEIIHNNKKTLLNTKNILLIGRLSPEKRPMDALEIFKLVHDIIPDVKLNIVGHDDSNYVEKINKYIKNNCLENSVTIYGEKKHNEIFEYYCSSACMIFTSAMEGYPMTILESKAYGLPIAMYELPYLELVKDNMGIMVAKQGDIKTMAENIIKFFENDKLRKKLANESVSSFKIIKKYNLEKNWINIINLCCKTKLISTSSYYNPNNNLNVERAMMEMLLEKMFNEKENSTDFKVGNKILKIPRKIKKTIIKFQNIIKS